MIPRVLSFLAVSGLILASACSGGGGTTNSASMLPTSGGARTVKSATFPCQPVSTSKGSQTAAVIATTGETITGTTIDASGCDIGIYVGSAAPNVTLTAVTVNDANGYGVFADTTSGLTVANSTVERIGNHDSSGNYAPNGVQAGIDYYQTNSTAMTLTDNLLQQYQKNGTTVVNGGDVAMTGNTVIGAGHVAYIAQNGIEVYGSTITSFKNNAVSHNWYTGPTYTATGYLLVGTGWTKGAVVSAKNTSVDNQLSYYVKK